MRFIQASAMVCVWLAAAGAMAAPATDAPSVRQLVKEGKVVPLDQLLTRHRERLQGRILDLELEREDGRVIYEVKYLDPEGAVREAQIDAQSGDWLRDKANR